MSNTFINTSLVVRDASILLSDNLVMANLCNRNHEEVFADKIGDSVTVKVPPVQTARDFIDDGSVTDNNITETSVLLELTEQPYVAGTLTTAQKSLELDDFDTVVVEPMVLAIRDAIDAKGCSEAVRGFARYCAGTEGNQPSTLAHIAAGRKVLQDNGAPMAGRVAVINTTPEASFIQLAQFTSVDYGSERPSGLREATLGKLYGIEWFADQNMATHTRGDIGDATNVYGAGQTGATLIVDDASHTAAGTVYEGSRFTVAGDTTVYTVTADCTASGGAFSLAISPSKAAAASDDAALTWKSAVTGNVIFVRNGLMGAVVAPAPLAIGSSSAYYNGVGVRVSLSSSTSALTDQIVIDTYDGFKVLNRAAGCVLQG